MDFKQFDNQLSSLTQEAKDDLANAVKTFTVKKGNTILRKGAVCHNIYFVNSGLCKTFFLKDEKEFIMRFFIEGNIFTVLDSFFGRIE